MGRRRRQEMEGTGWLNKTRAKQKQMEGGEALKVDAGSVSAGLAMQLVLCTGLIPD